MNPSHQSAADIFPLWSEDVLHGDPPTRWPCGDGELGRIEIGPGRVLLLGGAPGAGKSALVAQIVVEALRRTPTLKALILNVEMPPTALLERQLSRLSGVDLTPIMRRETTADDRQRLEAGLNDLGAIADRLAFAAPPLRRSGSVAPEDLAQLLGEAGIGNAVIVVSACYSGGFVPVLKAPDRTVITAARRDRPSFGCGNSDSATWFGRAFLVEALNATDDFAAAYGMARDTVRRREKQEGERPSHPQFAAGAAIAPVLARWRAGLPASAPVPYPFVHAAPAGNRSR